MRKALLTSCLFIAPAATCQQATVDSKAPQCPKLAPGKPYHPGDALSFLLHFPPQPASQYMVTVALTSVLPTIVPADVQSHEARLIGFGVSVDNRDTMRFRVQIPGNYAPGIYQISSFALSHVSGSTVEGQTGALSSIIGLCIKVDQTGSRKLSSISAGALEAH